MSTLLTAGMMSSTSAETGGLAWRACQETLYGYLRRDFRDALVQERRLYPKNWDKHVIRPVPFVWALARELATAYVQEPGRRWTDLDGKPLSDDVQRLISAEYRRARVNRVMRHAHRQIVALNVATIWSMPDQSSGGVSLELIPPHDQEVQRSSPFGRCEDDVSAWRFRVPLPVAGDPQLTTWAIAEITPTRATWTDATGDLKGRGLYVQDGSNPWGIIPVAMLRGSEPGPGEWWPPAPEDILAAQRAMTHDLTDVGTIARLQGFGQPVIKSQNPKDAELELGPETAVAITDPAGDFGFRQADPQLDGYVTQLKEYASAVIGMNGLSPATFTKSTGITAVAKQMELIDRESYRKEHMEILRTAEQRLYDVMRVQINWMRGGVEVWPAALVEVEYREPVLPVDPLHDAQALDLMIKRHQTSEARARALRDGTSVEEAKKRIAEEMGAEPTPTDAPDHGVPSQTDATEEMETLAPVDGPPSLEGGGDVQKAALNGAQVAELRGLIEAVALGMIPAGSARAIIIAAYPVAPADVDAMLSPLDGFAAAKPAPAVPFGAPPVAADDDEATA